MKKHSYLAVLATVSMLTLSVSCSDRYQEGFDNGKAQGYEEGYVDGDADGFERAKEYFASADYNDGYSDGKVAGIQIGYDSGKVDGYNLGRTDGYNLGYADGDADGYSEGYVAGEAQGYGNGYDDGHEDGKVVGYSIGFQDGYDDGYLDGDAAGYADGYLVGNSDGYDDGYLDGNDIGFANGYSAGWEDAETYYGFAVGKSKSLRGYANLLSMAHNDLFDYSKIQAPTQTKRGVLVNGNLLMSETSLTNKDTLKRAAVVEQYLVTEMASQVKGKFGLSTERSLKIAKAANHFRKYASKRALTNEDTNAYASEIIGADLASIENAYEQSMKGDISGLNDILKSAAEKNGTSPEKMATIVTELFI